MDMPMLVTSRALVLSMCLAHTVAYPSRYTGAGRGCFVPAGTTLMGATAVVNRTTCQITINGAVPSSGSMTFTAGASYTVVLTGPSDMRMLLGSTAGTWSGGSGSTLGACSSGGQSGYVSDSAGTTTSGTWTAPAGGTATIGGTCGEYGSVYVDAVTMTGPPTQATSVSPTAAPSTRQPTSAAPTNAPTTAQPSLPPTARPTAAPSTRAPTGTNPTSPTNAPSTQPPSAVPTINPTAAPTTRAPTGFPTIALSTTSPTSACSVPCDMNDAGSVSGAFAVRYKLQALVAGCPQRVCFELDVPDVSRYRALGLSQSGSSMGSFEKLVVGRMGTMPYVWHASADPGPGDGETDPSGSLIRDDPCITSLELDTTTLRFARPVDGSTCQQPGPNLASGGASSLLTVSFVALAEGSWVSNAAVGGVVMHGAKPTVASSVSLSVSSVTVAQTTAGATNAQRQTHGTLMSVAWIVLTPCGVFTARNLRGLLGTNGRWFKLHMFLQVAATFITVIAIIMLTSQTEDELDESKWPGRKIHQRLGVSVLALVLIQVLMGFFRNVISGKPPSTTTAATTGDATNPNLTYMKNSSFESPVLILAGEGAEVDEEVSPSSSPTYATATKPAPPAVQKGPRRWIFNAAHLVLGLATWATAVAAMYYGVELMQLFNPEVDKTLLQTVIVTWVMVVVGFFALIEGARYYTGVWDKSKTPVPLLWIAVTALLVIGSIVIAVELAVIIDSGLESDD